MFRTMRRAKQVLTEERAVEVLEKNTSGVLAVAGDDNFPYAVPLSYIYDDGKIYFHTAKSGHKLDAITKNEKVSFCVIDEDTIVPEEYTTYFRSVIAFGHARILEEPAEKRAALEKLAYKYSPNMEEGVQAEINGSFDAVTMVEIAIDHLSGKEAIEYVKAREGK